MCLHFQMEKQTDVRSSYGDHDVQILRAGDDGSADFLVYGYMNRGPYEGQTGVIFYRYDAGSNTVQEKFFIPVVLEFEKLKKDVEQLAYVSPGEMVYLMLNGNVFGIDLSSNESISVAQGLTGGNLCGKP